MKINELKEHDLSLWVARALGMTLEHVNVGEGWMVTSRELLPHGGAIIRREVPVHHAMAWAPWAKWEQGGPIIVKQRITMKDGVDGWGGSVWEAVSEGPPDKAVTVLSKDYLRAAMLCVVKAKYGAEVPA